MRRGIGRSQTEMETTTDDAQSYRMCTRCLYATSIPTIQFDVQGVCELCKIHDEMENLYPLDGMGRQILGQVVEKMKRSGKSKDYDCVIGVSGGRDSTYTVYKAIELGLRPLAVHFDNGWNSEIAVSNIRKILECFNIDLVTVVANWEEFKDLQIAFLQASTTDAEIPTDVAIHAALHDVAARENINYILIGHSFRTEGIVPKTWTYMDGRYIDAIHRRFGHLKRTSFPNITLSSLFYYNIGKGIRVVPILNYFPYDKIKAGKELEAELGWVDYGSHHHESIYTVFFQSYLLPRKFRIDKRRLALSARVRSGQTSRDEALKEISDEPYPLDMDLVDYTIKKLGLSNDEFDEIMKKPVKSFLDYPTYYPLIRAFRSPLRFAFKLGLIPNILYYKYVA